MSELTRDPVNQKIVEIRDDHGVATLGLHTNKQWHEDPKHLLFSMARYKFIAKMLSGKSSVLEAGCGDAFCSRLVKQEVDRLVVADIDPLFIADVKNRIDKTWPVEAKVHDFVAGAIPEKFSAIYSLDVLEHIDAKQEKLFLNNVISSLESQGVLIVGMPSIESQNHSKPASVTGHINCKTGPDLKRLLEEYFTNVFLFSMNDEIVHTGFSKMANYIFVLCAGLKQKSW